MTSGGTSWANLADRKSVVASSVGKWGGFFASKVTFLNSAWSAAGSSACGPGSSW